MDQAEELKRLRAENARLKKVLGDIGVLIMSLRDAVDHPIPREEFWRVSRQLSQNQSKKMQHRLSKNYIQKCPVCGRRVKTQTTGNLFSHGHDYLNESSQQRDPSDRSIRTHRCSKRCPGSFKPGIPLEKENE